MRSVLGVHCRLSGVAMEDNQQGTDLLADQAAGNIAAQVVKPVGFDDRALAQSREVLQRRSGRCVHADPAQHDAAALNCQEARRPVCRRVLQKIAVGQAQEVAGVIVYSHVIVRRGVGPAKIGIFEMAALHHDLSR